MSFTEVMQAAQTGGFVVVAILVCLPKGGLIVTLMAMSNAAKLQLAKELSSIVTSTDSRRREDHESTRKVIAERCDAVLSKVQDVHDETLALTVRVNECTEACRDSARANVARNQS